MMTLDEYLASVSRRRWLYGEMDCVQFGLGWARARTGRQLAAPLAYRGAESAQKFLDENGGLLAVVTAFMAANGFPQTDAPDDGDIGVAEMAAISDNGSSATTMIRRGPWWLGKSLRGVVSAACVQGIPAWRIS